MTNKQVNKTTKAVKLAEEALYAELEAINSDEFDAAADKCYEALAEQSKCACDSPAWCTKYKKCNREVLGLPKAQPVKQEPVAVISESAIGLVKLHANGVSLPFGTQLYAAPVQPVKQEEAKIPVEPVAEVEITYGREPECYVTGNIDDFPEGTFELYAAPVSAKREWVDLTDDEIATVVHEMNGNEPTSPFWRDLIYEAIAAFKEKNK